jgi:protein-tyrosine phosphatase
LLIKNNLIDFIASDAHNTTSRPPNIKKAFEILSSKIGIEKSRKLFYKNQCKLFIDIL